MVDYDDLTGEQQDAVDALDRNVILTAGAGTGKTTTLTARYLEMIEDSLDGDDDEDPAGDDTGSEADSGILLPENILTTTFTERAANDLEETIRTEIAERVSSLDEEEYDAWRTVADDLEEGYIHTLHGFCARLLREHALTCEEVDPGFDTIDEDEARALMHDTVGMVLEEYEDHEATRTLARRFSRSQLRDILTDLLDERPDSTKWAKRWADASEGKYISFVESELHPIDPEAAAERLADPDFVEAAETLRGIVENPPDIETGGRAWERAVGVIDILEEGFDDGVPSRSKQTTIAQLSTHLTTGGDRYANYAGAKSRWNGHPRKHDFDVAFETLVETLEPERFAVNVDLDIEANSFPFVQALADLTLITAREYDDRKHRQNVVDFTDLITYAVEFLAADENEHVRQQLRDQFEYVMVDEFQDTDPRQWDLIKLLTASNVDEFDAQNVFVVGDVKQSIYRFRNADVTQFQETAQTLERLSREQGSADVEGKNDDDSQLTTNFRTVPTVLETINELFDTVFDEDGEPYEAAPQELCADRDDPDEIGSVEYLAVPTDADHREDRFDHYEAFAEAEPEHDAELEAMALASRLSQILAEPYQVYPEPEEREDDQSTSSDWDQEPTTEDTPPEPRDIEPSDIAILIRSRTHLKKYERALEDAGVPYSVASGIGFYETPEITALLNLFRGLADPSDERALYGALRSPLFGFPDDKLAKLKITEETLWDGLEATDDKSLSEAYELLRKWRQLAGLADDANAGFDDSWAAFLTEILEVTGYFVSISAGDRSQQAVANVEKFREQLRGWSDDGVRSLTTLVKRIERRIELGGRESEADTTGEGVQILTIHDAKGMEFPFVVVPGLSRDFNDEAALGGGMVEFERIGDQHAVGMKAPSTDDPFDMTDTIARETIRERRRDEERAEEKRVLYVACTRARDHLLLTGLHDLSDDADSLSFTNLEDPDVESPSSWRDWVQPELLTEHVGTELDETNRVQRRYGDEFYTVSVPTPKVELEAEGLDETPDVALSPSPPTQELTFRLSATDLASLLGGYGEIDIDEDSQTAFVRTDQESPDQRYGESESVVGGDAEGLVEEPPESESPKEAVSPAVFGEMVHRICELRPPESKWSAVMEQTLVDEDAQTNLTSDLVNYVSQHVHRALEYLDKQKVDLPVEQEYDELYVTAEFDSGEIVGYIDHLILTPDTYHIIDYKTGNVTPHELEEDARYYLNQMKAYAVALNQQDTGREVRVSLVFTEINEVWETEWDSEEINQIAESITSDIEDSSTKSM